MKTDKGMLHLEDLNTYIQIEFGKAFLCIKVW